MRHKRKIDENVNLVVDKEKIKENVVNKNVINKNGVNKNGVNQRKKRFFVTQ